MLLNRLPPASVLARNWIDGAPEIRQLDYDSRSIQPGSFFFAVRGQVTDGHRFLPEVLQRGALAVASERHRPDDFPAGWVRVDSMRPFMAHASHHFYGQPSKKLPLIGVTGTNGKTTTAYLIHSVLEQRGAALLMGTIRTRMGNREWVPRHTTPEAVDVQRTLAEAVARGCRSGVVEVSSHALALHRVYRCHFPIAVFTNLTQEHLDFHKTFRNYFQTKQLLFDRGYNPGLRWAVLNGDDACGRRIQASAPASTLTFGLSKRCDVHPVSYDTSLSGTEIEVSFQGKRIPLRSHLVGVHNVYNILAAAASTLILGMDEQQVCRGIERVTHVSGRFEKVPVKAPFHVIVDYAHTPDALENVLNLSRRLTSSRVLCVFGCGGDRDREKRPLMGAIAVRKSDHVILTSDNPRSEPPDQIVAEICRGIPSDASHYEVVLDRRAAIECALRLAAPGDLVLVAGKGHERYQEIGKERIPFDDSQVVKELI